MRAERTLRVLEMNQGQLKKFIFRAAVASFVKLAVASESERGNVPDLQTKPIFVRRPLYVLLRRLEDSLL